MGNSAQKQKAASQLLSVSSSSSSSSSSSFTLMSPDVKNCVPKGLYPRCHWDAKVLKKLISDKLLAPIFVGVDSSSDGIVGDLDECPICMLYYPGGLNYLVCCKHSLCTECFLQVKPPTGNGVCPFCNFDGGFKVEYRGTKSREEKKKEMEEQRHVEEAQIRAQREELKREKENQRQKELLLLREIELQREEERLHLEVKEREKQARRDLGRRSPSLDNLYEQLADDSLIPEAREAIELDIAIKESLNE